MSLFNWIFFLKGYPLNSAKIFLSDLRNISFKELESRNLELRNAILKFHFENNSWYRSKIKHIPINWTDLPVLTKSDLQVKLDDLISKPFTRSNVYVANTSGSSGHPFFFAKDKFSHALTWAQIQYYYSLYGINSSSLQARFYGIPLSGLSRKVEITKDFFANRVRFPVFDLSDHILQGWLVKFTKIKFNYLYGYTSSLLLFAKFCDNNGVVLREICPTLRLCITTSEVLTQEDRVILSKGFGLPVVNEYGASETGLIAFEVPSGSWELCDDLLYIEFLDDNNLPVDEGKSGRIVITSLHNKAFPLIRYEVGDIGIWKQLFDGRRELIRLQGRTSDFIKLPSGKISPGLTLYYVSRGLLESNDFIREFIIVQTKLDTFQFHIASKRPIGNNEVTLLKRMLAEYLEEGLKLEIIEVDEIQRPNSGKIKHFYSLLS